MKRMKKLLCLVLVVLPLLGCLAACGQKEAEAVTIYPCYLNKDVTGTDATTIRAALEQAGWELQSSKPDDAYGNTSTHIYVKLTADGQKQGVVIYEFESAAQAEQAYVQDVVGTIFPATVFPDDYSFYSVHIRISNCLIMTMRNAHVELLELLELGTPEALEVPTENTQEVRKTIGSVDIESVKSAMEADGYAFYPMDFAGGTEFSPTYLIVSPEQNRAYLYTHSENKPMLGVSFTYYTYSLVERAAIDYEGEDVNVGMHFVGFKDGGCVLCYKDSFAEIETYFTQ